MSTGNAGSLPRVAKSVWTVVAVPFELPISSFLTRHIIVSLAKHQGSVHRQGQIRRRALCDITRLQDGWSPERYLAARAARSRIFQDAFTCAD